ncbi:MAG TPA: metallophosphoesterase [bacterium]|nr:metallophosphoesterase [bacterium]
MMLFNPYFWFFLFCQFLIFVYIVNRVSFHPRRIIPEGFWVVLWTLFFAALETFFIIRLAHAWDFDPESFMGLPVQWKVFVAASALWVLFMAVNHLEWHWFRVQKVPAHMTRQAFPNHPPRFKLPLAFLEKLFIDNQLYDLEVVEYEVPLPGWPEAFSGLSIVQVSDIHFGKYIHKDFLRMVVEEAKKLKPDLYTFTGDFVSFAKDIPAMRGLLRGFKAPLGAYALLGNHDHWADGPGMRKALEDDGFRVLQNEVVYLKRKGKTLALLGVDDLWEGKKNEAPLLAAKGDAKILLAHQPDHFYLAKKLGVNLQISGHCHGGQICFPVIGPLIVPTVQGRKYAAGFMREKGVTLFIHRGIGGFPPIRTLCRPQVVKLVLKSA